MCAEPVARVALVVEDHWIVRDHIVSALKPHGWTPADILAACHNLIATE